MEVCSNCQKKKNLKSIADLFNISPEVNSISKNAHLINGNLIKILRKEHSDKLNFMQGMGDILAKLFQYKISNFVQVVSLLNASKVCESDIYEMSTDGEIMICKDTYSHSYYSDYDNVIMVRFGYKHSVLKIGLIMWVKRKFKETDLNFEINSKDDFYVFLNEFNKLIKEYGYKFNPEYDMSSNELDNLLSSFVIPKIKKHNKKAMDNLLSMVECGKIANMFLCADMEDRLYIKTRLHSAI